MLPFDQIPVPAQNLCCLWALLVCLAGMLDIILLWRQKRFSLCTLSFLCFFLGYSILHLCGEGTYSRLHGRAAAFALSLLSLPFALLPLALLIVSALCLLLCRDARSWGNTHISAASIKECVDSLPAGVCYYLEEGQCILVNHRMNEICFSLLGRSLQDGNVFCEFVRRKKMHALSDGTAVSFRHRVLSHQGLPLHELIADDITELYEKSEELRAGNERARQLAENMRVYGETIADTVRRQEILRAKAAIHDEMNRRILASKKSMLEGTGEAERRKLLRMWQEQALLLCKEADRRGSSNVVSDLNALAELIGIRLEWRGMPGTERESVLALFLAAAREAMANAAKHAEAECLSIDIQEEEAVLRAAFSNDGKKPSAPVRETGGLLNLRGRVEKLGGQMLIDTKDRFCLTIVIPKEGAGCHIRS